MIATQQKKQQDELLSELERLLAVSEDELLQRQQMMRDDGTIQGTRRRLNDDEDNTLVTRIKELESACKFKDQAISSLKAVVEQQETAFDEKLKIIMDKYDQIKAINMALQVIPHD